MTYHKAKKAVKKTSNTVASEVARVVKNEEDRVKLTEWLDGNDPLYDRSGAPPITISELFSTKLIHKTFTKCGMGEMPYDWTKFRTILEKRVATSPRWFMQLREEDLLADDGFEGVTVDCIVIAEASVPTLAPAHYIVKVHMPFSDLEDNAPERILPIDGQNMCWRRVVRDDGKEINAYLLQKRETFNSSSPANFGFGAGAPSSTVVDIHNATSITSPVNNIGFGFGTTAASNSSSPANFGFGAGAPSSTVVDIHNATSITSPVNNIGFGFGTTAASNSSSPANFGFGAGAPSSTVVDIHNATSDGGTASANVSTGAFGLQSSQGVAPLKPSEVLFALWSKKRLAAMAKSLKSGSRIVLEDFRPSAASPSIKLVMQNDLKDDVTKTVRELILNKLFAKRFDKIVEVDRWINNCPVYDERLTAALQKFRASYVHKISEDSEEFQNLYDEYHTAMEAELNQIVEIRKKIVQQETACIDAIMEQIKEGKIAEKHTFRLLKYYASNDVMRFRPFGKVSGISEMGESADVCDPPAPVFVNPFMAK